MSKDMADMLDEASEAKSTNTKPLHSVYAFGAFDLAAKYAKQMDENVMAMLVKQPAGGNRPIKPTRWQLIKRYPRKTYMALGERLTRKLMDKFEVYDDWY